ncbi:hypothetical protein G6646_00235 [Polynucleobacter paneuropaeus]|nr:hypothetical protein [Polynucleobacter paneuropaeus]QWD09515.1 hypothetical protein G6713_01830 [Polynucleobacter paneuropaeus]
MKKVIVTTTINNITEAIDRFDSMGDWILISVGDLKTPKNYKLKNGVYLSPFDQEKIDSNLSDLIGWNCIQRRNFGLLYAHQLKADIIALVDDDNIPYDNWGKNLILGQNYPINCFQEDSLVFDPVGATNYPNLWHRGFPLQLINSRKYLAPVLQNLHVDIQADFWNGDPDIDAICRMEHAPNCDFKSALFPFSSTKYSPFNSQNTFISSSVLSHYFLFPHVGRMDDIWASYYVQSLGFKVAYNNPSVFQQRNEHNLIDDMRNEYLGYENNLSLVNSLMNSPKNINKFLPEISQRAFCAYRKHFINE